MSARPETDRAPESGIRRRSGRLRDARITLSHGSGGKAMRDLIDDVFADSFDNPALAPLEDQARLPLGEFTGLGDRLAFTTDSHVVDPLYFPGGDIGALAVNGTVNDLAVSGARPLYLSCGVILEEGLEVDVLRRVARSMRHAAAAAGVRVATGDTKVVHRGAADRLFINTAGVGALPAGIDMAAGQAQPGDAILVNGCIGDHGAAILKAREDLALDAEIESDCQPLHGLIEAVRAAGPGIRCLRDATRGGIATVLNEFAQASEVAMAIDERRVPVRETVRGLCEILGLDPLYLANEGRLVAVVPADEADAVLAAMRAHPAGEGAVAIGSVRASPPGVVTMATAFGGDRIVDTLVGDQLPRIC